MWPFSEKIEECKEGRMMPFEFEQRIIKLEQDAKFEREHREGHAIMVGHREVRFYPPTKECKGLLIFGAERENRTIFQLDEIEILKLIKFLQKH